MLHGVIEGFYGTPWSWHARVEVMRAVAPEGLRWWVHAPKDDPLHRERWGEPWTAEHLDGFARLAAEPDVAVGVALSPGLSMAYDEPDDRARLLAKAEAAVGAGASLVVLCVDDIPVRPGLGPEHAALVRWLHDALHGRSHVALIPTEYTGSRSTPYLDALAGGVPPEVPVGWTGATVVADRITAAEARARAEVLGGRPPLVWDNVPVNDVLMADRLLLGPLRGRDHDLPSLCSGWLANPMVQPRSSVLPLRSVAAFLRGEDPEAAWRAAADEDDLLALAEACDGARPAALVAAVDDDPAALRSWLAGVAACETGPLGEEAAPWAEQARREARLGLSALHLLEDLRGLADGEVPPPETFERAVSIAARWPAVRRAAVSVMGPRCSFRPVVAQDDAGRWVLHEGAVQEDQNAVDALVRLALRRASASGTP